ncbi:MAG: hypothetical protein IPH62_00145 [Ignavibacteriae bacterium]|nr:hypothetical protein [Ignavibacteriota bacterium]
MNKTYSENIDELKILLDYSWQKYHIQHNFFESLDSKSSRLTTFIGILFTVISGFVYQSLTSEFFQSIKELNCHYIIWLLLILLLLIAISTSFYFSLSALSIKKVVDPSKINKVKNYLRNIEKTEKQSQRKLIIYIINSLSDSEENVREINIQKSKKVKLISIWLKISLFLVLANLVLYSIIIYLK